MGEETAVSKAKNDLTEPSRAFLSSVVSHVPADPKYPEVYSAPVVAEAFVKETQVEISRAPTGGTSRRDGGGGSGVNHVVAEPSQVSMETNVETDPLPDSYTTPMATKETVEDS